jgi:hypothetical protein
MSRLLYAEMILVNSKSLIKSLRKILRNICICDTPDHSTISNYQLTKSNSMKTQISFIQRVHHTKNNKDVWINLFNMTDEIKYAGQDEYIVRNYLVNVMKMILVNSKSLIKSLRKILRNICICDTPYHSTISNYQLTKSNRWNCRF